MRHLCVSVYLKQAFTTDFRVHWAQHPLRPEFVESTYFIYKVRLFTVLYVSYVITVIYLSWSVSS